MINRKWNSERTLVVAHVVLTRTLSACKAREIRARINRRLYHWEIDIYVGLVWDALEEGRAGVSRVDRRKEED